MNRAVPVAFRIWSLSARLVLVLALARYLSPAAVGLYGLISATSAYTVYVLGMDMYTYTTREILASSPARWRSQIMSHTAFLGCVSIVTLPLLITLFYGGVLPWSVVAWFYLITASEHVSLEIDRLLVALNDQFAASVVILVRQGMLPTIFIPIMALMPEFRNTTTLFSLWILFNLLAIAGGSIALLRDTRIETSAYVDWAWLRRGVAVAAPFLLSTLCLRIIFTVDRQIVATFSDLATLGAYTLYIAIAGGLTSLLAVAVHQFIYPALVKAAEVGDPVAYAKNVKSLWRQTVLIVCGSFIVAMLAHTWVGDFFDDPIYSKYAWLLPFAIGVIGIYNISLVPHYGLYSLRADKAIHMSTASAVIAFAGVSYGLIINHADPPAAVLAGILSASLTLLIIKTAAYRTERSRRFQ